MRSAMMQSSDPRCTINWASITTFSPSPSAQVSDLLSSNFPPSDSEQTEVSSILGEGSKRLASLDDIIAQLQSARRKMQSEMQTYASVLSPVRRLPPEILVEIFVRSVEHPKCRWRSHKSQETIWRISQVCRHWRAVALSSASLWSHISVMVGLWRSWRVDHKLRYRQRIYLERSSSHPLNISIDLHDDPDRSTSSSHPVLELLLPTVERWRALRLFTNLPSLERLLLSGEPLPFSSLRTLQLGVWSTDTSEPPSPIRAFENTPLLRKLGAHSIISRHFHIPWHQITSYTGPNNNCSLGTNDMHLDALSRMTNLTSCRLRCDDIIIPHSSHSSSLVKPITLPHLRSLSLSRVRDIDTPDVDAISRSQEAVNQLLEMLVLPALQDLEVCGDPDPQRVASLVERSGCRLTRVHLPHMRSLDTAGIAMDILECSSGSLEELFVSCSERREINHFVDQFATRGGEENEILGPRLRRLVLEGPELVEDWIRMRVYQTRPLVRVSVSSYKRFDCPSSSRA